MLTCQPRPQTVSSLRAGAVTQLCHPRAWYTVGALIKVCETHGCTSERSRRFLSGPDAPASSERGCAGDPERRSLLGCSWEKEMFLPQFPPLSPSVGEGRGPEQWTWEGRELLGSRCPRHWASTSWFSSPAPTQQAHSLAHGASPHFAAVLLDQPSSPPPFEPESGAPALSILQLKSWPVLALIKVTC